ncbi:MAG: hypothetical protein QXS16_05040, partial [Pyrobaculum sp.]
MIGRKKRVICKEVEVGGRQPKNELTTCPVCGKPGYKIIDTRPSGRQYLYFRHNENGKYRQCYAGPIGGYVLGKFMKQQLLNANPLYTWLSEFSFVYTDRGLGDEDVKKYAEAIRKMERGKKYVNEVLKLYKWLEELPQVKLRVPRLLYLSASLMDLKPVDPSPELLYGVASGYVIAFVESGRTYAGLSRYGSLLLDSVKDEADDVKALAYVAGAHLMPTRASLIYLASLATEDSDAEHIARTLVMKSSTGCAGIINVIRNTLHEIVETDYLWKYAPPGVKKLFITPSHAAYHMALA